jgi:NAD(P)-dependent dehydrogenase (short-subunit alcohol dehydrogenase family)
MDLELSGKRALVVGGSGGIGKAIAAELLGEGALVTIAGFTPSRVEEAALDLSHRANRLVHGLQVDIRDEGSVSAMTTRTVDALGGLDILVNTGTPQDRGQLRWQEITAAPFLDDVNLKALGYLRCAQSAVPHMIENGWGRIVNIGGINVRRSTSLMGTVRNAAVGAVTKHLADQLGQYGITVNVVHPGSISTERERRYGLDSSNILGRHVDSTELAWIVAFLASPRSSAITGESIPVGGGLKGPIYY